MTEEDRIATSDHRSLESAVPVGRAARGQHDLGSGGGAPRDVGVAPEPKMTFKEIMSVGGRMTLAMMVSLQLLDSIDNSMFNVFAPEIRESLGLSSSAIAVVAALAGVMVFLGALPLGILGDRYRRTTIAGICTLAWAVAAGVLGLVQNFWQVAMARILAGIGKANEAPIQTSLLADAYPLAGRGRVLGMHRGAQPLGIVIGPLLTVVFAAIVPEGYESWRWAFVSLAVAALVLGLITLRLREPVRGRFEQEARLGGELPPELTPRPVPLPAALARLRKIRTFSVVMVALSAFGLCVTTVPTFLSLILEDNLGQGVAARGMIASICAVGGLAGTVLIGIYSDRLFRRSPAAALYLASGALATLGIGFGVQAYSPNVATYIVIGIITQGMTFGGIVPLSLVVASVTPPKVRATAFALVGLGLALVGGLGGALLTGLAEQLWGTQAAVAVVAPAASVMAGLVLVRGASHLRHDIAQATADIG